MREKTTAASVLSDEQLARNAVQPTLPTESVSNFPAPGNAWSDVARLCRRVCVLHERGHHDEAERVRLGALADLVAAVRDPADATSAVAARLEAIMVHEADRVASAAVLAELLLPILTQQLRSPSAALATSPVAPPPAASPTQRTTPRTAVSIADFIDVMIAQENATDRSARTAERRAS